MAGNRLAGKGSAGIRFVIDSLSFNQVFSRNASGPGAGTGRFARSVRGQSRARRFGAMRQTAHQTRSPYQHAQESLISAFHNLNRTSVGIPDEGYTALHALQRQQDS